MELDRALAQVAAIQDQLTRADVYRGYRSLPVAGSGIIGLAAAWMQPRTLSGDPAAFVGYWVVVALGAAIVGVSEIAYNYLVHDEALARQRTRRVVGQLLPSLLAAAIISAAFVRSGAAMVPLLPGLWALCFGIGIFASRPFIVQASKWVAFYFYAMGVWLLWNAQGAETLSPWAVGGTFGVGQLLGAAVLYWNLETGADGNDTDGRWSDGSDEKEEE